MFFRKQRTTRARYGGNPLYQDEPTPWITRRLGIDCILLVIVLGAWATTLSIAPYFQVTVAEAPTLLFISEEQTRAVIGNVLRERLLGVLPRTSFWVLQTSWLEARLNRAFPFAQFSVSKTYPNLLAVRLREPIVLVDWVTGTGHEYYVDRSGAVVYRAPSAIPLTFALTKETGAATSTPAVRESALPTVFIKNRPALFPLVFDPDAPESSIGDHVVSTRSVALWQRVDRGFRETLGAPLAYIDVSPLPDHLRLVTEEGWAVFWNEEDDVDAQIQRLAAVLRQKVRDARPQLEYIDLRFGDKVYFKRKK